MPAAAKKKPKKTVARRAPAKAKTGNVIALDAKPIAAAKKFVYGNAALKRIYERLRMLVSQSTLKEADVRYQIGEQVSTARQKAGAHGDLTVAKLAVLLGYDKSTLHDYGPPILPRK